MGQVDANQKSTEVELAEKAWALQVSLQEQTRLLEQVRQHAEQLETQQEKLQRFNEQLAVVGELGMTLAESLRVKKAVR